MKHVMQTCSCGQIEADGDVVDQLGDAVRPEVAGLELARRRLGQGGSGALAQSKESPVAYLIGYWTVACIIVVLLDLLSLLQPSTNVRQELVTLLHAAGHSSHPPGS